MNKAKKILALTLIFVIGLSSTVFASNNKSIKVNYFGTDACLSCAKTEREMKSLIDELRERGVFIELIMYDTLDDEDEELFLKYNNHFNVVEGKYKVVPAVFIGDSYLIGDKDIKDGLEDEIMHFYENMDKYKEIDIEGSSADSMVNLTTLGIFVAGLLDGINPCSIAMMLFFISFLFMTKDNTSKSKILILGFFFALGTFIAYLGIGIGLFKFIYFFSNMQIIMKGFYLLLFLMAIYLAYINILDYINIKKGKEEEIKNQLSRNMKRRIHSVIKKYNSNSKLIYLTAFVTAFVISFLEFFCTGQIYLPVITYMIKTSEGLSYIPLLILYNLAFILPLLTITVLLHLGREVIDISTVLVTKLHSIKIIGAIFFICVAIYSMYQVVLI